MQNVARVLHDNRAKFPKHFFAIVQYTNIAAMTSVASQGLYKTLDDETLGLDLNP